MRTGPLSEIRTAYFLGIAGIGMSALARYFRDHGVIVSGYDADRSALARTLEKEGIEIQYTEEESILDKLPDLVVYTPAIPSMHKGFQYYLKSGVPVKKRSEVLGWISHQFRCIAVAGTHGKTTTSAMVTFALRQCGVDVSALLGGLIPDLGGNYVKGRTSWIVVEADEYDRSFLTLEPEIAIVTAMDPDHLDIYGTADSMVKTYLQFLGNIRKEGIAILHAKASGYLTEEILDLVEEKGISILTYGSEAGEYRVAAVEKRGSGIQYKLLSPDHEQVEVKLQMPGVHNALNASAAIIVSQCIGVDPQEAANALGDFSGIKRRFEIVHADDNLVMIDDYAHHPEELAATIKAARMQFPNKRLTGVFQPHLYSRTKDFYKDFALSLDALDACVLVELYPARELPIEGVSSKLIFDSMLIEEKYLKTKSELTGFLGSLEPEVLLLLGAGDLDRMIPELIQKLGS